MHWFRTIAPIRQKTFVAFGSLTGIAAFIGLCAALLPTMIGLGVTLAGVGLAAWLGANFRRAICDPYVSTVVRMEALAAGDLESPIEFTDYQDCVGRMTKAMFTFRDSAVNEKRVAAEQNDVVKALGEHLEALAEGDLTAQIKHSFPQSYEALRSSFNAAMTSLHGLIGAVAESASAIRTGSQEIASASEDLSRRTESNAASLEETSAAIAQMDDRLKTTAEAATRTVERADKTIATVENGRTITDDAVHAMGRVSDSAKGIDAVIEGLDKIAFQTRVLAMNAAVEAGRAGEAGRGFAVVADLVSALAMRAEEEAKRAREQLTVTQNEITGAVDAVRKVDGALANISGDVTVVHELLAQMAADNRAQSSAIGEITAAVSTMDQSTQQNAAMVEETSAAARTLTNEVVTLADQAARFRTDGAGAPRKAQGAARDFGKVKPLPAAAIPALIAPGSDGDWASF